MSRIVISKEFTWDMAHMLAEHPEQCKNLHGHTYKLQVNIFSMDDQECEKMDMVIDFGDLKRIINDKIVSKLDHSFAYFIDSPDLVEREISKVLCDNNRKIYGFNFRPTAEKMVHYFYELIKTDFSEMGYAIESMTLWETPTSYARFQASV